MALAAYQQQLLETGKIIPPIEKSKWVELSDRTNVHAKGIVPAFSIKRKNGTAKRVYPACYEQKYQYVFDNYILNRHPNEHEDHYQWRLATYPTIAQEVYLKIEQQILGSLFQNNQYTVSISNDKLKEWANIVNFQKFFTEELPSFIFREYGGLIVVMESHLEAFTSNDTAMPIIMLVDADSIKAIDENEVLFEHKGIYYYIDKENITKFTYNKEAKRINEIITYNHGFNEIPVIQNNTQFFKPYIVWADLIGRNISDDEVIAKNASYPHKQVVEPICNECQGHGEIQRECETGICTEVCTKCDGRGTISINPGEIHVIKERDVTDARPMMDMVKFINPDVAINEFSLKRWQLMYDKGMASMHCKLIDSAQSGEAKAKDRENFYFLVSNIAKSLFDMGDMVLKFASMYLNVINENGSIKHVENYDKLQRPQQFAIKSEYDLQNEYMELLKGNADLSVRRDKLDYYISKAYAGNNVGLKRHELRKQFDFLYAMTDVELQTRKLLGTAQTSDFIRHDMVDFLMNKIINESGEEFFVNSTNQSLLAKMEGLITPYLPNVAAMP